MLQTMVQNVIPLLLSVLLFSSGTPAIVPPPVEIFDIEQEKVVKTVPNDAAIQKEAKKALEGISGMVVKVNPIPKKGFMIRIFLETAVTVRNEWLDQTVDRVILLFPTDEAPFLLVFDPEDRPLFFHYGGSEEKLLKLLDYKPSGE